MKSVAKMLKNACLAQMLDLNCLASILSTEKFSVFRQNFMFSVNSYRFSCWVPIKKNLNNSQEYYLTDIFTTTSAVKNILFYQDAISFLGVNDQEQLEVVSTEMKRRKIQDLRLTDRVFIPDSSQVHIDWKVKVGEGTILHSGTYLLGKTVIGKDCHIGPQVYLQNTILEDSVTILPFSSLERAYCARLVSVGPFARLRPESRLDESVKIGNFVEVKKSHLKKGVKVSHLSYVGDATIGQNSNIGCGFITCNYDGKNKHETTIGANTFIGSDCQAIAPIVIGDSAFVAAGTTITENVPSKAFAIGRSKQLTREGYAERFLKHDPNAIISQK